MKIHKHFLIIVILIGNMIYTMQPQKFDSNPFAKLNSPTRLQ